MRYHALVINLFSRVPDDETSSMVSNAPKTPESPPRPIPESKYNTCEVTQGAARDIAELTRLYRREFGVSRTHHFAMYAINLALFVMLEQESFDVLDEDFLSLASAFTIVASQSALGRNLFHIFRQSVQAKGQGDRVRGRISVPDELKVLFDEKYSKMGYSRADEYADRHEIKVKGDQTVQDYPGLGLSDMLDRYESLSLGNDKLCF